MNQTTLPFDFVLAPTFVLLKVLQYVMRWYYSGMMSATATLGLILLWDVDSGLTQIDKYLYSNEDYIKVLTPIFI